MNPELMRNLWLELSPRRLTLMFGVLALLFATAALGGGNIKSPATVAEAMFILIVILWDTRKAADAVIGEIRDRTWDGQRLSAIPAWSMVWGKLFGSTSYVWAGGAFCIAILVVNSFVEKGEVAALYDLFYY